MLDLGNQAVVLYGRAAFDRSQALPALADDLRPTLPPGTRVEWAFADLTGPSLPDVLDRLAAEEVREAVVVTCMVPADPSLSTWLAGALSQWSADRSSPMSVRIAAPIERALDMAVAVRSVLGHPAVEVASVAPSLGKPGWSKIPEHRRQVFFCVGARCLHRGAEPLYQHLRARLKEHRVLSAGPRRAMCARSTCLFPCNLGPVMVVHPDGAWYGGLTRERLDKIVSEHLLLNRPVQEAVVHVTPGHPDP